MKKIITIALLSLFSLTAHAWELCPPSTAFWHTNGSNTPWVLDPTYTQRGWSIKEDKAVSSDLKFLPPNARLYVEVHPTNRRARDRINYVSCKYYLDTSIFSSSRILVVNENTMPASLGNFKVSDYLDGIGWPYCKTTNSMTGKCSW